MSQVKHKDNIVHSFVCLISAEVAIQKGALELITNSQKLPF